MKPDAVPAPSRNAADSSAGEAARMLFWRGLDEIEDPAPASALDSDLGTPMLWQRHEFMKLMGASLALRLCAMPH